MRRLMRRHGQAETAVFPGGRPSASASHKSGAYGSDIVFPVTTDRDPNLNGASCIDKNP